MFQHDKVAFLNLMFVDYYIFLKFLNPINRSITSSMLKIWKDDTEKLSNIDSKITDFCIKVSYFRRINN